jgi:hypothetical protein
MFASSLANHLRGLCLRRTCRNIRPPSAPPNITGATTRPMQISLRLLISVVLATLVLAVALAAFGVRRGSDARIISA